MITDSIKQSAPQVPLKPTKQPDVIKLKCAACRTPMRVPLKVLEGKKELPVKCPNMKCGKITRLKKNIKPAETAIAPKPKKNEENVDYGD
jgi:hypothetical protein